MQFKSRELFDFKTDFSNYHNPGVTFASGIIKTFNGFLEQQIFYPQMQKQKLLNFLKQLQFRTFINWYLIWRKAN